MLDPVVLYNVSKHLNVLIVEDHEILRQGIIEVLSNYFLSLDSAENGFEALEKYKAFYAANSKTYDLVISDIEMPRMNGIDLTAEIYSIREDQPIIVLSAHQDAKYLLALINFGVAQFITKPVEQDQMLQTLYNVCKKITNKKPEVLTDVILLEEGFIWNKKSKTLKDDRREVSLTKHELYLMEILSSNIDKVCSTDDILNYFFINNIDINAENIRNMVFRMRKKLPKESITSIYGLGYKLSSI
jgi:DNA-binding response OmpR family regulator